MVETISPVVYGTRTRWAGALALHAAGATATAAAFGALVAAVAAALGAPWGRAGAVLVAAVAVLYLIRELAGSGCRSRSCDGRCPIGGARTSAGPWRRSSTAPVSGSASSRSSGTGRSSWSRSVPPPRAGLCWGRCDGPVRLARGLAPLVSADPGSRRMDAGSSTV